MSPFCASSCLYTETSDLRESSLKSNQPSVNKSATLTSCLAHIHYTIDTSIPCPFSYLQIFDRDFVLGGVGLSQGLQLRLMITLQLQDFAQLGEDSNSMFLQIFRALHLIRGLQAFEPFKAIQGLRVILKEPVDRSRGICET